MALNLELLLLGTGNATTFEGRAPSSFVVNDRYLFDAGPAALQQLKKARVDTNAVQVVLITHFHADHIFGLPFLFLEYWASGRDDELQIVGPPGIEARAEELLALAFPGLPRRDREYRRHYIEVGDGTRGEVAGLEFEAFEVEHVPTLRCFGYRVALAGRTLVYGGDSVLCGGLLKLVEGADVLVLNCSFRRDPVHLAFEELPTVVARAAREATTIVSHVDAPSPADLGPRVFMASDLDRFRF